MSFSMYEIRPKSIRQLRYMSLSLINLSPFLLSGFENEGTKINLHISIAGEHPAAMQHGGSCGMAPTILLASITLIIANLLRWAAASWIAHLKNKKKESETCQKSGETMSKVNAAIDGRGRYTFGKIVRSTAIDHFSLRFAVTRCVYSFVECSEATTRESQYGPKCSGPKLCEGRSDVADDL